MDSNARSSDVGVVTIDRSGEYVVATDSETVVASQGETKADALENLAEALRLHRRPASTDSEELEPAEAPWLFE